MRVMHWAAVALAGVLLAQPALGQGGGAGGGVPQNDPNAPTESGAENLNKPTGETSEMGTGSSEADADGGTLHKAKSSKKHKRRATKSSSAKSSEKSSQSEEKGAPESGGAQGK